MIDTKKEQEREELHRAIWAIADELRGAVDGWDFKSYVLGTMFYRYISENLTAYINKGEHEAGNAQFDYARMSDAEAEEARERRLMDAEQTIQTFARIMDYQRFAHLLQRMEFAVNHRVHGKRSITHLKINDWR